MEGKVKPGDESMNGLFTLVSHEYDVATASVDYPQSEMLECLWCNYWSWSSIRTLSVECRVFNLSPRHMVAHSPVLGWRSLSWRPRGRPSPPRGRRGVSPGRSWWTPPPRSPRGPRTRPTVTSMTPWLVTLLEWRVVGDVTTSITRWRRRRDAQVLTTTADIHLPTQTIHLPNWDRTLCILHRRLPKDSLGYCREAI